MKAVQMMKSLAKSILRTVGLYYPVRNLYRKCKYNVVLRNLHPFNISYMVLCVGQACNYKCKNCGNFAPYAPAEFMRYKLEDIISWMKQILEAVDSIDVLQIQGGEPFAYSDLGRLIVSLSNFGWGYRQNYTDSNCYKRLYPSK